MQYALFSHVNIPLPFINLDTCRWGFQNIRQYFKIFLMFLPSNTCFLYVAFIFIMYYNHYQFSDIYDDFIWSKLRFLWNWTTVEWKIFQCFLWWNRCFHFDSKKIKKWMFSFKPKEFGKKICPISRNPIRWVVRHYI